jgi:hypothetical protein
VSCTAARPFHNLPTGRQAHNKGVMLFLGTPTAAKSSDAWSDIGAASFTDTNQGEEKCELFDLKCSLLE